MKLPLAKMAEPALQANPTQKHTSANVPPHSSGMIVQIVSLVLHNRFIHKANFFAENLK